MKRLELKEILAENGKFLKQKILTLEITKHGVRWNWLKNKKNASNISSA